MIKEKVELTGDDLQEYWKLKKKFEKELKEQVEDSIGSIKFERRFHWFTGGVFTGIIVMFIVLFILKNTLG